VRKLADRILEDAVIFMLRCFASSWAAYACAYLAFFYILAIPITQDAKMQCRESLKHLMSRIKRPQERDDAIEKIENPDHTLPPPYESQEREGDTA
jgi:hypothetical protein